MIYSARPIRRTSSFRLKTMKHHAIYGCALVLALATTLLATMTWTSPGASSAFIDPVVAAASLCGARSAAQAPFLGLATAAAAAPESPSVSPRRAARPTRYGAIGYIISARNIEAQAWFDEGYAHFLNFNHDAAMRAFRRAQHADPQCAMCYWGEALALGPNINAPMADSALAPANAATRRALALKPRANKKERDLIDALALRYPKAAVIDRSHYDGEFADAMEAQAARYADDDFILTLAAEANMDTQPWAYWLADGRTPDGRTAKTLRLLETVLERNPNHVAAIHLYIHLTEASLDPHRALPHADRLAKLSPGLGHLIHMPAHSYYRVGRYKESLAANVEAAKADEAWIAANDASATYEFGYYVHNLHFIVTSAQMAGDAATALEMAAKLDEKLPKDMVDAAPFSEPIKAAPYFVAAQFAQPEAILSLKDPGKDYPFLQGAWRYARGEAFARLGDVKAARAEARELKKLIDHGDFSSLIEAAIPAVDILTIAERTVTARAASAEGDLRSAIAAMTEAVAHQESIAYQEPPYWYYPAKQTLAAMTLKSGNAERAEQLFMETLVESPNNGWAYFGLAEAFAAQNDKNGARLARSLFKRAWAGGKKAPTLNQL